MAFLDNSGDIILDAVLTDLGRKRLAAGNFRISKFALGDEEVNYNLFNPSDSRGSAFYDLEIMQTPVLEAFTSDQSLMKTRLMSFSRNNILYMPILKINNKSENQSSQPNSAVQGFTLMADNDTITHDAGVGSNHLPGFVSGLNNTEAQVTTHVAIDQGIDSGDDGLNITQTMDESLLETAFIVKVDHRLLRLQSYVSAGTYSDLTNQFIDDDAIATYYIMQGQEGSPILGPRESNFRERQELNNPNTTELTDISSYEMFAGPLGNVLRIVPRVSNSVQQSTSLFAELGSSGSGLATRSGGSATSINYKFIDTIMSVTGMTTGYSIDVPIRIIKKV
mgnify:CR=1 FL=1|tara:strand:- start:6058 stop:7065 length:1008 start_codon:yes stop_codon:yes gene_type:complete